MKLAQFRTKGTDAQRLGLLAGDQLIDVAAAASLYNAAGWLVSVTDTLEVIRRGDEALREIGECADAARAEGVSVPLDAVEFLPPVWPSKILAIGRNYVDHAIEGGEAPPSAPLVFNKLVNSLGAHDATVPLHDISEQVDYEAELAVVIGRRAKRVGESEAWRHVFGYTPINDVSARDLQFGDGQWVRGKGLDGFAPLGPYVTTRDEVADAHALRIEGRLNGVLMQSSNTSKMIFKIPYLLSYISQGITLEPGDVIATGTPEGVGIFRTPPVLLRDGDVFEVTIEGLGTLRNTFAAPRE